MTTTEALTAADTLDRISALLREHPDLPPPFISQYSHRPETADLKWYLHINDKGDAAEQKATAQAILRTLGGHWDKRIGDHDVDLTQNRDGLSLHVVVTREAICTRRVVGTKSVTVPAVEAQPERTETVEVVEWDCHSLLADDARVSA